MESKNVFMLVIYIFINFVLVVLSQNPAVKVLSNQLSSKAPVLTLAQMLMTAKLMKDYQQRNAKPSGNSKTRYMLFVGKGNIQFQNHELEVSNSTEPIDSETTTEAYDDLAKNKPLLKFVARNGYQVWKRMLELPPNSNNETDMMDSWSMQKVKHVEPERKERKKPKDYKPAVQMIESENGVIEHKVNAPRWFKDIVNNGVNSHKKFNKFGPMVGNEFFGLPNAEDQQSVKHKNKAIVLKNKKSPDDSQKPKRIFSLSNSFGRVVINGFNGIIRGIGSLFGFNQNKNKRNFFSNEN